MFAQRHRQKCSIRRAVRILGNGLIVSSLLLCVVSLAAWVRSRHCTDWFHFPVGRYDISLYVHEGGSQSMLVRYEDENHGFDRSAEHLSLQEMDVDDAAGFLWKVAERVPSPRVHLDRSGPNAFDAGRKAGWFPGLQRQSRIGEPPLPPPYGYGYLVAPLWAFVLVFAMPAFMWWCLRMIRRRPTRPGRCRTCGYDLRATPDRCPECGTSFGLSAVGGRGEST